VKRNENSLIRQKIDLAQLPVLLQDLLSMVEFDNKRQQIVELETLLSHSHFPKTFLQDFPCIMRNTVMDWFAYIAAFRTLCILFFEAQQLCTAVDLSQPEEINIVHALFQDATNPVESVRRFVRHVSGRLVRIRVVANQVADDLFRQVGKPTNTSMRYHTEEMAQVVDCHIFFNHWRSKGGETRKLKYPNTTIDAFVNINTKYATLVSDPAFSTGPLGLLMQCTIKLYGQLRSHTIANEYNWCQLLTQTSVMNNNTVIVCFDQITSCFSCAVINIDHWLSTHVASTLAYLNCSWVWHHCVISARSVLYQLGVIQANSLTLPIQVIRNLIGDQQIVIQSLKGSTILETLLRGVCLPIMNLSCPLLVSTLPELSPFQLVLSTSSQSATTYSNHGEFIIAKIVEGHSDSPHFDIFVTNGQPVDFFNLTSVNETDRNLAINMHPSEPVVDALDDIDVESILLELDSEQLSM
jgi:hypothetical protein